MKYKPELAENLPAMFKNGEAVEEVIVQLGIRRSTFYEWVKKYPEFADAYEHGKELSHAWWYKLGRFGAAGKAQVQPTVFIFNMKNRIGWGDQPKETEDDKKPQPLEIVYQVEKPKSEVKITRGKG